MGRGANDLTHVSRERVDAAIHRHVCRREWIGEKHVRRVRRAIAELRRRSKRSSDNTVRCSNSAVRAAAEHECRSAKKDDGGFLDHEVLRRPCLAEIVNPRFRSPHSLRKYGTRRWLST